MAHANLSVQSEVDANDLLPDIDRGDLDNQLAVTEYVEEIYKFYKKYEGMNRVRHYLPFQSEINENLRAKLVDWLIEVHLYLNLMPETLHLTINLLDRFLSTAYVSQRVFRLVGLTAMLIASKYEEVSPQSVRNLFRISDMLYSREVIRTIEKAMLNRIKFRVKVPTPYVFLLRFLKAADPEKEEISHLENLAFFLTELSLAQYIMVVKFSPSLLASAAIYTARCTLKKTDIWTDLLKCHTGYSESDLMKCVMLMVAYHRNSTENGPEFVRKKFSTPEFNSVALLSPASLDSAQ